MKDTILRALTLAGLLGWASGAAGQAFTSGSNGSYGALDVQANQTLNLPADGIFHCTTIQVAAGATLRFNRNPLNTPVYLLATGDVTINGIIDVSGTVGSQSPPVGGQGGPGGFDGGAPGAGGLPPGAGRGPGAGKGGQDNYTVNGAGGGAYGTASTYGRAADGATYGSPLLIPLVGGSGGGGGIGSPGYPGGGGGGAILIASDTRIAIAGNGSIRAEGKQMGYSGGSGGAVRLVAPAVSGTGSLRVPGGSSGGAGRVRIDSFDRTSLALQVEPSSALSLGSLMMVFPSPLPRLDITEAAGTVIAEGTAGPVQVLLPFGSSPDRTVTVQARDFGASVPIRVVLTPENGTPVSYDATIDNAAGNPATAIVNVTFPVNTVVQVNAWTR
jgi:hypothetical protein